MGELQVARADTQLLKSKPAREINLEKSTLV
jgi:hypothetical protein